MNLPTLRVHSVCWFANAIVTDDSGSIPAEVAGLEASVRNLPDGTATVSSSRLQSVHCLIPRQLCLKTSNGRVGFDSVSPLSRSSVCRHDRFLRAIDAARLERPFRRLCSRRRL